MRIIVIPTLTVLLFFYPSIYLPMSSNQLEQLPHKKHQVDNEGRISNNDWLIFQTSALAETIKVDEKNYCNDPNLNLKWEILVKKYPDDMGLHALHALRLGLCFKVGMNDISLDDALKIFEDVKKSFVEKKIDELLEDTNEQKKDM